MNLFANGLEYLIQHLQDHRSLRDRRFPRATLDRITSLAATALELDAALIGDPVVTRAEAVAALSNSFVSSTAGQVARALVEAVDPWALPAELTPAQPREALTLESLRAHAVECRKCPHLVAFRRQVVFGTGNPDAAVMFVGEAPGAEEDVHGEPFVGRAGELLTKIIETMGFSREEVYIANVLKCRPDMPPGQPGNRPPTMAEMEACLPFLREQIDLIKPEVMVALGSVAMRGLFGTTGPMRDLRGRWHEFGSIPVMATFHPSYLLRNQALSEKRKVWDDMLLVLERLQKPISEKQRGYFLLKP
jgi:uracil-DNA glycosylase family 4